MIGEDNVMHPKRIKQLIREIVNEVELDRTKDHLASLRDVNIRQKTKTLDF